MSGPLDLPSCSIPMAAMRQSSEAAASGAPQLVDPRSTRSYWPSAQFFDEQALAWAQAQHR